MSLFFVDESVMLFLLGVYLACFVVVMLIMFLAQNGLDRGDDQ
jgi:Sec-independent protein secretion pathway component TatC